MTDPEAVVIRTRVVGIDRFRHCFSCCEPNPCDMANVGLMLEGVEDEEIRALLAEGAVFIRAVRA